MEIRAYAIQQRGEAATPFVYHKTIGPHDVLVRITHRSITTGDIQFIDNEWGDTQFPLVPSHEMVGSVEQTGRAVTDLTRGDRVGIGFQLRACFECSSCRQGVEQFCPNQTVVGVNAYGGLGDHIAVDSRFAFRLPSGLDSAPATPLMSSGLTVYSAIAHAQLPPDARVAVLGIGGLGRLALQFLRAMEHRVSAFSRSPEKGDVIRRLGADYIDGSDATALGAHRSAFDFILSTLNVPFDLDLYLRMLRPDGRFCFVAAPLEPLPLRAGALYDYARRCIYGSYVGSRSDAVRMLAFAAEHDVLPSVEVTPFSQLNEAIGRVRRREMTTALVLESLVERAASE
jgi:D-arabinose 1-dehydrogenase-like Zn-dependent alcohol dehydrogenase